MQIAIDTDDGELFNVHFEQAVIILDKEQLRALWNEIEGVLIIHDSKFDTVYDDEL